MNTWKLTYWQTAKHYVTGRFVHKCACCKVKGEPLFQIQQHHRTKNVCSKCAVYGEARTFRKYA